MKKLVLAAALAACAAPAAASNWVTVGRNTSQSVYEVDLDSVQRDGNSVTFWLRVHYGSVAADATSDGYVARRHADCSDRSYNDLQTDYMMNGKVTRTSGAEEKRFAAPDSIAAAVINKVCGK